VLVVAKISALTAIVLFRGAFIVATGFAATIKGRRFFVLIDSIPARTVLVGKRHFFIA
jgi:hypothetical protein